MIKWPEPVGFANTGGLINIKGGYTYLYHTKNTGAGTPVHTEAQLKQAVRDAYEEAAEVAQETVCDTHIPTGINIYGTRPAKAIRTLIKEIQ